MIEQIENKIMNFIDEKEDVTEVNYLETEANSEDEYIDNNDLQLATKSKRRSNIKEESTEDSKDTEIKKNAGDEGNLKIENEKMYHFGLHDVNDDLFNTLKKDKKIVGILSELNSNNTKKDISLSEMSSDLDDDDIAKKILVKSDSKVPTHSNNSKKAEEDSEDEYEEEEDDDENLSESDDESENLNGSDTSSDGIPNIQVNRR